MTGARHIVLLNGSPKGNGGSSGSFGNYILSRIPADGSTIEKHHVEKALKRTDAWDNLVKAVNSADCVILTFPLYWDSTPSHLTKALELLRADRAGKKAGKKQSFYIIVQNGFPEPWHNETAIEICKCFSVEAGFEWKGALNLGGGGAINGRPLEETGGMTYKLRQTLDMSAMAIGRNDPIPPEVEERLRKPLYSPWINILFGGIMWRRQAKRKGIKGPITARPYEK